MTQITWSLRLVNAEGAAVVGHSVQLQVFDMAAGWKRLADATTGADGRVRGKADDGVVKPVVAAMLRLADTARPTAVLGGIPTLTMAGAPPALTADFGDIVQVVEPRPVARRAALGRAVADEPPLIGGVAAPVAALSGTSVAALRDTEARLAAREVDLTRLQGERDDLAIRSKDLETRLQESESRLRDAEAQRKIADAQLVAARDQLKSEQDALATRSQDLEKKLEQSEARLRDTEAQLKLTETQLAAAREATLTRDAAATDTFTTIDREPILGTTSGTLSLGDFATKLGGEIDSAQTALRTSSFSLGTVSITARTVVEGSAISFPSTEDLKTVQSGTLSDVSIVFNPTPVTETSTGVQVPDVRFLTEGAARRVLTSVGLVLEVSQGPAGMNPNCAPGQAMLQAPAAGTSAPRGSTVLAIFARTGP
jgi:hypothetical protein